MTHILILDALINEGLVWVWLFLYTVTILAVYYFGLPSFSIKNNANAKKSKVSHGLSQSTYDVIVYDQWYTPANVITVLGILGLSYIPIHLLTNQNTELIPVLFLVAVGLTDWLDGKACLKHKCHTRVGAIIDPVRDRLAIMVLLIILYANFGLNWLILLLVIIIGFIEHQIYKFGIRARNSGTELNTHGPGKNRQIIHLAAIWFILCGAFLFTLSNQFLFNLTTLCLLIMIIGSNYAKNHYSKVIRDT